ncbi:hypothetical protein SAMN05421779_103540 [Insolitispirillum peregrinum]|uniref:Phage head morphogenesis protein, SPP1 gp7 family n=2 Tax=Insolitispirillum peregrinum TaxID=80876 RepID=A0A1N7LT14_9PROT|nr:hypothetical protein SAMN05421779_103540 [Insolitispirillum peregrinum]
MPLSRKKQLLDTRCGAMGHDDLRRAICKLNYRSAILKADSLLEETIQALKDALTRSFREATRAALTEALDQIREMDAGAFDNAARDALMQGIERHVGADALRSAMRPTVIDLSDVLYRAGQQEVAQGAGVDIAFGKPDRDALSILTEGNLYWVGRHWDAHTHQSFDRILSEYFDKGMTRDDLARRIAADFGTLSDKSAHYWDTLADHVATKTRELGRTKAYSRAGVEYVKVRAHMDAKTSDVCKAMHGRVIAVTRLEDQADAYLGAIKRGNMVAAKESWTMHGDGGGLADKPTSALPAGTGAPPYHHRCRTITVMYFAPTSDVDRWKEAVENREKLPRKDMADLVERLAQAKWRSPQQMKGHYKKHGDSWGSLEAYSAAAVNMIRRGKRDVYLSVRGGRLKAVFVEPYQGRKGPSNRMVVVDVAGQQIETMHKRSTLLNKIDDVSVQVQSGRGIMKWLKSMM